MTKRLSALLRKLRKLHCGQALDIPIIMSEGRWFAINALGDTLPSIAFIIQLIDTRDKIIINCPIHQMEDFSCQICKARF